MTEAEIVGYLNAEFESELILLGGSRADGSERPDSDWDLYLIGDYPVENQRVARDYQGAHLDIALFPIESLGDKILRIYYGPLRHLRSLLDNDSADARAIAIATKSAYEHGPEILSPERRAELWEDTRRILSKITGYAEDSAVVMFHMSLFYQAVIPLWFELRERWSLSIHEAIPVIRQEDPDFASLLDGFSDAKTTAERVRMCEALFTQLFGDAVFD